MSIHHLLRHHTLKLKRIKNLLVDGDDFCLTYGDGLSDLNIAKQIKFHKKKKKRYRFI